MKLSERLSSVASMVTVGNCLADVGTDHGYVPIYLYENHVIPHGFAMDVNKGPLERAKLHIAETGLQNVIETRLSDGLAALKPGEADTILIAGMGGALMIRILNASLQVAESAKELILQPQSEISEVRKWIYAQGYEISEEHMVFEDGKYYSMFKAVRGKEKKSLTEEEYRFGRLEVLEEKEILKQFLKKEISGKQKILEKLLKEDTQRSKERSREIENMIEEFQIVLNKL